MRNQKINLAVLSVKTRDESFQRFANSLVNDFGVTLVATEGTRKFLSYGCDIPCKPISSITGQKEMLDGMVKTIHPRMACALLADKDDRAHVHEMEEHSIPFVNLLVVELFPQEDITQAKQIDIGGMTMVRSAIKNYRNVCVVSSKNSYYWVLDEMANGGGTSLRFRRNQAIEAAKFLKTHDKLLVDFMEREYVYPEAEGTGIKG